MTSAELKAEALCWLRFGKRLPACCTELKLPGWSPDVLGCGPGSSVEVEVKMTRSDFRADFVNKAAKFWRYQDPQGLTNRIPNYMFYIAPENLKEYGQRLLQDEFPKAGLLIYRPEMSLAAGRNIEVVRGAERLHTNTPSPQFIHEVFLRTSSEVCGTRWALVALQREIEDMLGRVEVSVVEQAARHSGVLDIENPDADLESRAAELAACVAEERWRELGDDRKQYWRQGVRKLLESWRYVPEEWHDATNGKKLSANRRRAPLLG